VHIDNLAIVSILHVTRRIDRLRAIASRGGVFRFKARMHHRPVRLTPERVYLASQWQVYRRRRVDVVELRMDVEICCWSAKHHRVTVDNLPSRPGPQNPLDTFALSGSLLTIAPGPNPAVRTCGGRRVVAAIRASYFCRAVNFGAAGDCSTMESCSAFLPTSPRDETASGGG